MNWLTIAVILVIALMALVGFWKGFIKMVVGLLAMVIALVGTSFLAPAVSSMLDEKTNLRAEISAQLQDYLEEQIGEQLEQTAEQKQAEVIEKLPLPENVREAIQENNTPENYLKLGVSSFAEYVSNYVAKTGIAALSYLITFLVLYLALRIIFSVLNLVAHLPFLHGINKLAGGVLGMVHALVYVWVFFAVATAAMNTGWGMTIIGLIRESSFLSFLYRYNVVLAAILNMIA